LSLPALASIFRQAASALDAAHQQGVIHRDPKPANIFLCRRGERDDFVKIVDFGISKVLGGQSVVTRTQTLMGTPAYMSPEQAEERAADVDLRTDVYAMGTILYERLAGQPPLTASSIPTLLYRIVHDEPPRLRTLRADVPEAIEDAIHRALAKDPADRHASMVEFWQCFAAALDGAEVVEFAEPTEDRQDLFVGSGGGSWPDRTLPQDARASLTRPPALRATLPRPPGPTDATGPHRVAPAMAAQLLTTMSAGSGQTVPATVPRTSRTALIVSVVSAVAALIAVGGALMGLKCARTAPATVAADRPRDVLTKPIAPQATVAPPVDAAVAARADAAAPRERRPWVNSNPSGALVMLGSRRLGTTPLEGIVIPPGVHSLVLRKRGYLATHVALDAKATEVRLPAIELERRATRAIGQPTPAAKSGPTGKREPAAQPQPVKTKRPKGWIMTAEIK
jgi:serine/threonine-protein kinase